MIQSNILQRTCLDHVGNKLILICLNEYCNQNKLMCCDCVVNHRAHAQEIIDQNKFESTVQKAQQSCLEIVKQLNQIFDNLASQFGKLLIALFKKFDISIERTNKMDSCQLNQYIKQLQLQQEQQIKLISKVTESCKNFQEQLKLFQNDLGLQSLSYIELTQDEIKQLGQLYQQGIEQYNKDDYENAIQYFDQALSINPLHLQTLVQKGECLRMLNKYNESIEILDKALLIDPKQKQALCYKGHCLRILKQYKEAIISFDKAISIDPKYTFALYGKGDSLRMIDKYDESLVWYDKAISNNSNYYLAKWGKGDCLRLLGKYLEALKYLEESISLQSNHADSFASKAACLISLQKFDEAEICINKAIELRPNFSWYLHYKQKLDEQKKK